MAGKPKKNKAPEAAKPLDDEFPVEDIEKQPVKAADIDEAPSKTDKGKAPADVKKKKKSRRFKLSSIDPIILASFSIFMIACLIVTGITVYGIVAGDTSTKPAEYGDSVNVEYVGSYVTWYDKDGAVIFDTNIESIGTDESYKVSYGFDRSKTYETMNFNVGQDPSGYTLLDEFKNALIGARPGDTVWVEITDGYGTLTEGVNYFKGQSTIGCTVAKTAVFSVSDYKSFFGVDEVPTVTTSVKSPYGWFADVASGTDSTVIVTYTPVLNEANDVCEGLKSTATEDNGAAITFNYTIEGDAFYYRDTIHGDSGKMLKAAVDNKTVYIIGYDGSNVFEYKTTGENVGTKMYFAIKFIDYAE